MANIMEEQQVLPGYVNQKKKLFNLLRMESIYFYFPTISYNPLNIFVRARLVLTRHVTKYPPDVPQFSKLRVL